MGKSKKLSEGESLANFLKKRDFYVANIHRRLLGLIAEAHQEPGSIDVKVSKLDDGTLVVRMDFQKEYESHGGTYYDVVTETVSDRFPDSEEELNELEWNLTGISMEIESVKQKRIEAEQVYAKKNKALSKLTLEEKKLLGLA